MKADEIDVLASLLQRLGAELEQSNLALSPFQEQAINLEGPPVFAGDSFRGTLVGRDTTLVFDNNNPKLDISLPQLVNMLSNASSNAGVAFTKLTEIDINEFEDRKLRTAMKTARRMTVLLRDSLHETSQLLQGKDLDDEVVKFTSRSPREFEEKPSPFKKLSDNHPAMGNLSQEEMDESGYDGPMMEDKSMRPKRSVVDSTNALFLAEVYQDLRKIQGDGTLLMDSAVLRSKLQEVMNKIKNRTENGHA